MSKCVFLLALLLAGSSYAVHGRWYYATTKSTRICGPTSYIKYSPTLTRRVKRSGASITWAIRRYSTEDFDGDGIPDDVERSYSRAFPDDDRYSPYDNNNNPDDGHSHEAPDPVNPDATKANTEEPINFITGNNHFSSPEIYLPTPGIPLEFVRTYNSADTNKTALGRGWRHTYEWELDVQADLAYVTRSDAATYLFNPISGNTYVTSETNWKLVPLADGEHRLDLPGGRSCLFDTNGVLQSISDGWGNAVSLLYGNGLLISAKHSNGQSLDFSYSNGLLSAVTADDTLSVSFGYDTGGALIYAVKRAEAQWFTNTYAYSSSGVLTQQVDALGSVYSYRYDTNDLAVGMFLTDDRWYEHSVEYVDSDTRRVTYFRNGTNVVHEYGVNEHTGRVQRERTPAHSVHYTYSNGKDVKLETVYSADSNHWVRMDRQYDDRHNVTSEAFGLDADPANTVHYTWNTNWQVVTSTTDPEGWKTEMEYTNGRVSRSRIWHSDTESAETHYAYTTNGLLSALTNANGHTTLFTYDELGHPASVIPQAGPTVTLGYSTLGHLTNSTLPGGRGTQYAVTPLGWVEQITHADDLTDTFQYNELGDVTNHIDRAGRITAYEYLPSGKLQAVVRQLGSTNVTVSYAYDRQFNTLSIADELGRPAESYQLDALDRPTAVTNLEGQAMTISYLVGDFVDSVTRFDGTVVSNQYTGDGRFAAVHYPDETNRFTYLKNGLFQTLENSHGNISNAWNPAGWLTNTEFQVSSFEFQVSCSHDPVGNITNTVVSTADHADFAEFSYAYDEAERLEFLTAKDRKGTQKFTYACNLDNGRTASVSNSVLIAEYEYDILDRITRINWMNSTGGSVMSFDYAYNAVGMITNVVKTDGSELSLKSYRYDDLDRLISESSATSAVQYSYDFAGNRQTKTGSDYVVNYDPGTGNRLSSWTASSSSGFENFRTLEIRGSSSEPIGTDDRWGQLYVSNSVAVTPEISGNDFWIESFVTGLGTQKIVAAIRDRAGNMGTATNEIFLTVVTNGSYAYSDAGCLTNLSYSGADYSRELQLCWNSQYQLEDVFTTEGTETQIVAYAYDVLGRRISCSVGSASQTNTAYFVYDGNQVVADVDADGTLLRTYVWGTGIDNLLCFTDHITSNTYYAIKDVQNTVHALVDESGEIVERYEYDAWGRTTVLDAAGNELSESAIGNRYCFQGREIDWDTDLIYFRERWYDPVSGRWASKDPIGVNGGLNLYAFCNSNPVNYVDPYGEVGWVGAAIGALGGAIADVGMQYVASMTSGEEFGWSDINWKSVGVSAGLGGATGALGVGAIGQSKKAISAIKTARHMQRNLHARNIAMAAGKFRNPIKTAAQLSARNQALKDTGTALVKGGGAAIVKAGVKSLVNDKSECP